MLWSEVDLIPFLLLYQFLCMFPLFHNHQQLCLCPFLPSSYCLVPTTLSHRTLHYVCSMQMLPSLSLSISPLSPFLLFSSLSLPSLSPLPFPLSSLLPPLPTPSYTHIHVHTYGRQIHPSPSFSSYDTATQIILLCIALKLMTWNELPSGAKPPSQVTNCWSVFLVCASVFHCPCFPRSSFDFQLLITCECFGEEGPTYTQVACRLNEEGKKHGCVCDLSGREGGREGGEGREGSVDMKLGSVPI